MQIWLPIKRTSSYGTIQYPTVLRPPEARLTLFAVHFICVLAIMSCIILDWATLYWIWSMVPHNTKDHVSTACSHKAAVHRTCVLARTSCVQVCWLGLHCIGLTWTELHYTVLSQCCLALLYIQCSNGTIAMQTCRLKISKIHVQLWLWR